MKEKEYKLLRDLTVINESARSIFSISRDEYAMCSYIQYRSADSRQAICGWCCDDKDDIAFFVGISRQALRKMVVRLEQKNLIETGSAKGHIRVTATWIDTETSCKQSLQEKIEEKSKSSKQSLHGQVNKVYTEKGNRVNKVSETNNVSKKDSNNKKELEKEVIEPQAAFAVTTHTPQPTINGMKIKTVEYDEIDVEEPKKKKPSPTKFKLQKQSAVWKVDPESEIQELLSDDLCRERLFRQCRVPLDRYDDYVDRFKLKVQSEQAEHNNRRDFRSHFFNWASLEYVREQKGERPTATTPDELLGQISAWYHANPEIWHQAKQFAGVETWTAAKLKTLVQRYCARQIADGRAGDTFEQHNGRIQVWLLTETKQTTAGPSANGNGRVYSEPKFRET